MYLNYTRSLLDQLQERSDPKAKSWWEGYVKGSAPFLGVKMADIRTSLHQWHDTYIAGNLDPEQQVDLALQLFEGRYSEEKLAGTLFLQEILLPIGAVNYSRELKRFAGLYTNGFIYDWNICDWFCMKVLGPLILRDGKSCANQISAWHDAENLWQARASLVAFVPTVEITDYYPLIQEGCQTVIKREERFAKTAVGWILRDISKRDRTVVESIISENIGYFSVESLKNATKYFSQKEKNDYRQMLRDVQSNVQSN